MWDSAELMIYKHLRFRNSLNKTAAELSVEVEALKGFEVSIERKRLKELGCHSDTVGAESNWNQLQCNWWKHVKFEG